MKRMVVGVDGSDESVNALKWTLAEAALRHCRVHAVLCYDIPVVANPLASLVSPAVPIELLEQQATGTLDAAVDAVLADVGHDHESGRAAPTVTREVVAGHAGEALCDAAKDAELLVVGKHGHSGLRRLHLGSTSSFCVHHAHCPVVVLPLPHNDTDGPEG